MTARGGQSRLGCLVTLLFLAVVGYFGAGVGEAYPRHFRFRDTMDQEARFAARNADAVIRSRLVAFADSVGLPRDAHDVRIVRTRDRITIWSEYYEHLELPLQTRDLYLNPRVDSAF